MRKRNFMLFVTGLLTAVMSVPTFAAVEDTGFSDVFADAWYADAVMYCTENSLMSGTDETAFSPNESMTRAMLATVLYRMDGSPSVTGTDHFTDTEEDAWYSDGVLWASQNGIISGYDNDTFGTEDAVTREQIAAILWRYAGSPETDVKADFSDEEQISSWAKQAVDWAQSSGYMSGTTGNRFNPAVNATRAEVAAVLMRYQAGQNVFPSESDTDAEQNVLVAYFSRWGNTDYGTDVDATTSASIVLNDGQQVGTTELFAEMIQDEVGGDLYLIQSSESYPVDFDDVVDKNHEEQGENFRPELISEVDLSKYDIIFVGYPVWASSVPTPVLSFLESADLSGKKIIPFCTHDGYGAGSSYSEVEQSSQNATVEQGLALEASEVSGAQETIHNWLKSLELNNLELNNHIAAEQTKVYITIGDAVLEGILYDNSMAEQFISQLPQTISMSNYGGREVYGGIDYDITVEGEGQLYFDNGDITYCPTNNTAAIFYAQTDHPNLTMEVYPIGQVTSDLSVFHDLPNRVDVSFEVADEISSKS